MRSFRQGRKSARRFQLCSNELRGIVTRGKHQPHRPACPFVLVDLQETLPKGVDGYAYDGVGVGIKIGTSPKSLGRNRVLLDLIGSPLETFFADVFQHARQISRPAKNTGGQEPIEFSSFGLGTGFCLHNVLGRSYSSHGRRFYTARPILDNAEILARLQRVLPVPKWGCPMPDTPNHLCGSRLRITNKR